MNGTYNGIEYRYMKIRHNAEMIARGFEQLQPEFYTIHGKIPVLAKIFGYTRIVFISEILRDKNGNHVLNNGEPVRIPVYNDNGERKKFIAERKNGILTGFNSPDTVLSIDEREKLLSHAENVIRQQSAILAKKRAQIAKNAR